MGENDVANLSPRRYYPALDGLRGLSILVVLVYHLGITVDGFKLLTGGYVGVDVFFVLSGFLITNLLLSEMDDHGGVNLPAFYARRALRLFPALAVVIVFAVVAALTFAPDDKGATIAGLPWVIFYVGNWDRAFEDPLALGLLTHTWSLAVEEQFYIFWPAIYLLLFARLRRRVTAGAILLGAGVADALYRLAAYRAGWSVSRVFSGLDTHCDGLLVGCSIAFFLSSAMAGSGSPRRRASAVTVHWLTVMAAGAVVIVAVTCPYQRIYPDALALTVGAFGAGVVVWGVLTAPIRWMTAILESRAAVWIGKRSYGLYLWHYPIITAMNLQASTGLRFYAACLVAVVLSFLAAALSYQLVELPFLRIKRRFERTRIAAPEASAGTPTDPAAGAARIEPVVPPA